MRNICKAGTHAKHHRDVHADVGGKLAMLVHEGTSLRTCRIEARPE
jgi:hypothetical protein